MQTNIILAGVGGQGILTIAAVIDQAALQSGLIIRQAEVHGMSQRGGAVQSHLRIANQPIYSDLIAEGTANLILSVEPLEALRYLPYLAPDGAIVTAITPFINIENYPPIEDIMGELRRTECAVLVDAVELARNIGNIRAANMIMLGAAASSLGLEVQQLEKAIATLFHAKGEDIVEMNISAFRIGMAVRRFPKS